MTKYHFDFLTTKFELATRNNNLVFEIPRSFERSSPSNFRTQGSFIHINSGKIFERHVLSSDSVAKSAKQNLGFSETELRYRHFCTTTGLSHFPLVALLSSPATLISFLVPELSKFKDLKNDRKNGTKNARSWIKSFKIDKICDVM